MMKILDTKNAATFRPLSRSRQKTGLSALKTFKQKTAVSSANVVWRLRKGKICHSCSFTTKVSIRPSIADEPEIMKRKILRCKDWRHH